MLYNVTTMATTWNTVATQDTALLKSQMDTVNQLPREYIFLNYLRCHDDIGWGLDYGWLSGHKFMQEIPHKKYLNDYFTGNYPGSPAKGELYNDDPRLGDARLCGTCASLCGVEKAFEEQDEIALANAIRKVCMLHAYVFTQSGIPIIYSGDEIGQFNDWSYHDDEKKKDDSRYIHRGDFQWDLAEKRNDERTLQGKIYQSLKRMETFRRSMNVFSNEAAVWTVDTGDDGILCMIRALGSQKLVALFNFSGEPRTAWIHEPGQYQDFESGTYISGENVPMEPYGFRWLTIR
jgi:amylosucrase